MTLEGYEVVSAYVSKYGLNRKLPEYYKRRDDDEPRAREKEKLEDQLALEVRRRFREIMGKLEERLEMILPNKANRDVERLLNMIDEGSLTAPKHEKAMMNVLITGAQNGVDLFSESIGFDINWTTVNDEAAQWAQTYSTEWLSGLRDTERNRIRTELTNFVEQEGYTVGDIVDGLKESGFDDVRSQRIATTEITRAYGESAEIGARRLQKEFPDVEVIKTWFTNRDGLVCPVCRPLNNQTVGANEGFGASPGLQAPPAHVNCLPGDTPILSIGDISAGSKRWYEGNVVTITTAENELTVTPNHPIMTDRGWVAAGKITEGDKVAQGLFSERISSLIEVNKQHGKTMVKDVFSSFDFGRFRVPVSPPDFHNDGAGSDVAVIRPNGKIMSDGISKFLKPFTEDNFFVSDIVSQASLSGSGSPAELIEINIPATGSVMSRSELSFSFACGHMVPFGLFGFGSSPGFDIMLKKALAECPTVNSKFFRESVFGFPVDISFEIVTEIRNADFAGHVYNLQTDSGIYLANNIITHNCRCWIQYRTSFLGEAERGEYIARE